MIRTREEIEAEIAHLWDDISNIYADMEALEGDAEIANIRADMEALEKEAKWLLADIYCLEDELADIEEHLELDDEI